MNALQLYKFITENKIEYHYTNDKDDVYMFVNYSEIEDFHKILSPNDFDEYGIECIMKDGYFAFKMKDLCEIHDIELKDVFTDLNA